MAGRYSFGDSDVAARRLALMARVFEPTSRALLAESVPPGAGTALDLGCGPGNTTRLLAEVARPRSTLGLDSSERYVAAARAGTDDPAVSFACHDVTSLPLPGAPADVVYARLLLAHLPDARPWPRGGGPSCGPTACSSSRRSRPSTRPRRAARLRGPGGGRRRRRRRDMYAGPLLAPLGGRCLDLDVDAAVAGRMFGLNLATWRDEALAHGLASRAQLHRIAEGLTSLVEAGPGRGTARWVIRQLAVPA